MRFIALASLPLLVLTLPACSSDSDATHEAATGATGSGTAATGGTGSGTGAGGGTGTGTGAGTGGAGTGGASTGAGGTGTIGGDRPVDVHVPPSYDGSTPVPLVILLHGYTATGALQESYFKLTPLSDERGFLYATPDGLVDPMGNHFWNATDACCNIYNNPVDDSTYLQSVIDDIKAVYNVDPKRVFFVGHSNGGFMSHRMACDHADSVAAFVSLAGSMWDDTSKCNPSEPVAMLQIHGTADATIAYLGGAILGKAFPSAQQSVEDWATVGGCSLTATPGANLDLEASLVGDETTVSRYLTGCNPGGHAELWTVVGGSHIPSLSADFAPGIIDFLYAHPKP